ncbi:helix-turn-helix domain-containing protein [Microbacterium sp.]|uniref:helix-turn-helix domain-containing protein n=1 Tax=Microbacterium sp. TaxID=51671 RepID=UPI00341D826D
MTARSNWSWQTHVRTRVFELVKARELSATQGFILLRLMEYANWHDGRQARPGMATLANDAGVTERTVSRALRLAKDFGLIEETHHGGGAGDTAKASEFRFLAENLAPSALVSRAGHAPSTRRLPRERATDDATDDITHDATDDVRAAPPSLPPHRSATDYVSKEDTYIQKEYETEDGKKHQSHTGYEKSSTTDTRPAKRLRHRQPTSRDAEPPRTTESVRAKVRATRERELATYPEAEPDDD